MSMALRRMLDKTDFRMPNVRLRRLFPFQTVLTTRNCDAALMNIVETLTNLYYVYAQHVLGAPSAPLVGIVAVTMTLSKTVLYWAQEYYCGGCATGHNNLVDWLTFFALPNGCALLSLPLISVGIMSYSQNLAARPEPHPLQAVGRCVDYPPLCGQARIGEEEQISVDPIVTRFRRPPVLGFWISVRGRRDISVQNCRST